MTSILHPSLTAAMHTENKPQDLAHDETLDEIWNLYFTAS